MAVRDEYGSNLGSQYLGSITYEHDYFSGSQISLYMGDILIDSALAISYSVQQSRTPVFGYNSQYWSFTSDGNVLVSGELTIAFKESGYLLFPIQRYLEQQTFIDVANNQDSGEKIWQSPRFTTDDEGTIVKGYIQDGDFSLNKASRNAKNRQLLRANVEQMFAWENSETKDPKEANRTYNRFWNDLGKISDDAFENWAEAFEDVVWYGSDTGNPTVREKLFSGNIKEGTIPSDEDLYSHRRLDQYPAIDILISFGDMSRQQPNHTVKKLMDVIFIGQSQVIQVSGEPILESYSFIARNIA
jgi:hypothetical protein